MQVLPTIYISVCQQMYTTYIAGIILLYFNTHAELQMQLKLQDCFTTQNSSYIYNEGMNMLKLQRFCNDTIIIIISYYVKNAHNEKSEIPAYSFNNNTMVRNAE